MGEKVRYLFFFLVLGLFGCSWVDGVQSFLNSSDVPITSFSGCSNECQQDCREIFPISDDFYQCTELSDQKVHLIERAVNSMSRGIWNPITEEQISFIVSISHAPWIRYADAGYESGENMLIWIAEDENIPHYLDEDGEVLKSVLDSLSSMSFDEGVKDALSKDIEDGRTFLEMLAWEQNDEGFKRTHNVILNICDKEEICIRQTYCQNNSDIVPDTVNKLDLNLDFQDFDFACP